MIKLIRCELMKNRIRRDVCYAGIAIAIIIMFTLLQEKDNGLLKSDVDFISEALHQELQQVLHGMIVSIFLVFASVMHTEYTVDEYRKGTMILMFAYPISRKKILAAKIWAVSLFTFTAIITAYIASYGAIAIQNIFVQVKYPLAEQLTSGMFYVAILFHTIMTVFMSLLALFIGIQSKSAVLPIVAGTVLSVFIGNTNLLFTVIPPVFLLLIIVILVIAALLLMFRNIERQDIF